MKGIPNRVSIPAWYELGVKDSTTLVIRVHDEAFKHLCAVNWGKAPIIAHLKECHNLPDFIPPAEPIWGFGSLIVKVKSQDPRWHVFECKLPLIRTKDDERSTAYAFRSTLSVFFSVLWLFEGETDAKVFQLMVIESMGVEACQHGGSLGATLTPITARWISRKPENSSLEDVVKVMIKSDAFMWPDRISKYHHYSFRAHVSDKKMLHLSVPGDACGLDPSSFFRNPSEEGYKLSPHNVDSSLQQLTLLMGLAKLHDLVRHGY